MKAMRFTDASSAILLIAAELPRPVPAAGEILIRVVAAGITPAELGWYPTSHTKDGRERKGAVPGHEFSGVVEAVGEGVVEPEIGDEVFGLNDWFSEGALAEYCLSVPGAVALKPAVLSHVEAATVPIGALTAWQGLFDRAKLKAGERVLVHGAAGGVGVFAVQLAKLRGAHVVATASQRNLDFVKDLGAEEVIDYRAARFEEHAKEVDVVFDAVGGDTLRRSWQVLSAKGRLVTIASGEEPAEERTKQAFFIVEPNQKQLGETGRMLEQHRLRTFVDAVVPLADAAMTFMGAVRHGQGRGKLVVAVAGDGK